MRVGVIIPDRGDRPKLLANCLRMVEKQTLIPVITEVMDYAPNSGACDITERYRKGYDLLRNKNLDVIAFMENDDWYSPQYLETMSKMWDLHGRPDLFGTNQTIYYHIKLFAYFYMNHNTRSSAMSTLIKPDMNFPWCVDHEAFTDMYLWNNLKGVLFTPETHLSMGIKHGEGKCGGRSHVDRLHRYINQDTDRLFLKYIMNGDEDGYNFYLNYFKDNG